MCTRIGKLFGWLSLAALLSFNATAATYYVNVSNTVPASPFSSWTTAATNIQDAVDVSSDGDMVLVASGIYDKGITYMVGLGSNRVVVDKTITLQSVDGPSTTIIKGYQVPGTTNGAAAVRCAYLTNGAVLSGFTLTNGATGLSSYFGGGVACRSTNAIVENCIIVNNAASAGGGGGSQGTYRKCLIAGNIVLGGNGGGVTQCVLEDCLIARNTATGMGGGVYLPMMLVNCTVAGNSCGSSSGGGIYALNTGSYRGIFLNSIFFFNSVASASQYTNVYATSPVAVSNCCAPEFAVYTNSGCLTNWPGFFDAEHGDYRLQIGSVCINAGDNGFVSNSTDLDGQSRIFGGTVDMGAYENQFSGVAHFVSLRSTNPVAPYTNWLTAATNIQDAIDMAEGGETVIVSNGVHKTGGRVVYEALTNRIVLNKPVSVLSLNGPSVTAIEGNPNLGSVAVRCAYLTNGATLMGFTLTNGATATAGNILLSRSGGGVWCESTDAYVVNCYIRGNRCGSYYGAGAFSGTLSNCFIRDNNVGAQYGGGTAYSSLVGCVVSNNVSSGQGGGIFGGTVFDSIVVANSSVSGGGAASNVLFNCTLATNTASKSGGGAFACALTNCVLKSNNATNGGGAAFGLLVNCTVTNNFARYGGGACSNTLINCQINGNSATTNGGGTFYSWLTSSSLVGNSARTGGGAYFGNLTNCNLIGNSADLAGGVMGGISSGCLISNNVTFSWGGGAVSNVSFNSLICNNNYYMGSGSGRSGSYRCTLTRCLIQMNVGHGSYLDTLDNCIVQNNTMDGANGSVLNHCVVVRNGYGTNGLPTAGSYYGVNSCFVTNSIVYSNVLSRNFTSGAMSYACTTPLPAGSVGCFTNAPIYSDGNFHPATNSPCIDAGNSSYVTSAEDYDGRPRVVGAAVDVGVMEFQGAELEPFISWLYQYGLPNDGSADYADSDGDVLNNWQEWKSGTVPTNAASVLKMASATNSVSGLVVTWESVSGINYYLQRSSDLAGGFTSIASNLVGQAGSTSYPDTTATNAGPYFYRVGVE